MNLTILTWLSDDGRLILAARIIRTFGYGFLSVILSIYLALIGFNGVQVGLILSTSLVNGILFNVIASYYADKLGRRNLLIIYSLLMFSSGIIFFVTDNYIALIVAAFVGTIVAFMPAPLYLLAVLCIDRFDPEPGWAIAASFFWGGLVAILVSMAMNTMFGTTLGEIAGARQGGTLTAIISAPIFEEGSKGVFLLILLLFL